MGILDETKSLVKLAQQVGNMELYQKIVELQSDLVELYEENMQLRQKAASLAEAAKNHAEMHYDGTVFWTNPRRKAPEDGPYCPGCWGVKEKLLRLRSTGQGHWYCMGCQQGIDEPNADSGIQTAKMDYDPYEGL